MHVDTIVNDLASRLTDTGEELRSLRRDLLSPLTRLRLTIEERLDAHDALATIEFGLCLSDGFKREAVDRISAGHDEHATWRRILALDAARRKTWRATWHAPE